MGLIQAVFAGTKECISLVESSFSNTNWKKGSSSSEAPGEAVIHRQLLHGLARNVRQDNGQRVQIYCPPTHLMMTRYQGGIRNLATEIPLSKLNHTVFLFVPKVPLSAGSFKYCDGAKVKEKGLRRGCRGCQSTKTRL